MDDVVCGWVVCDVEFEIIVVVFEWGEVLVVYVIVLGVYFFYEDWRVEYEEI